MLALEACAGQFVFGDLAGTVTGGNGRSSVWRPTRDLVQPHLTLETVGQAHRNQTQMKQVGNDREKGRFLTAVLGRRRGEGTADLAVERATRPQRTGLVEEAGHLRGH